MRIHTLIFLALAAMGTLLTLLFLSLTRWYLTDGLLNYLNQQVARRMTPLVEQVATLHTPEAGWNWLRHHPGQFKKALKRAAILQLRQADHPIHDHSPPTPLRRHVSRQLLKDICLLDADKTLLIGRQHPKKTYNLIAIRGQQNDNSGRPPVIGWLALPEQKHITDVAERAYLDRQQQVLYIIGAIVLLVALFISWPLARYLSRPIQQMRSAIGELSHRRWTSVKLDKRRDEFGELGRDIERLANLLKQHEASRSQWLANTSHELRTPLGILKGEIEAMQDGVRPMSIEHLDSLHREVSHLQRLVDDIHQINKAQVGAWEWKIVTLPLGPWLQEQAKRHDAPFQAAGLHLTIKVPEHLSHLTIQADPQRLTQLLDNLLSNSLRYTHTPGEVTLTLWQHQNTAGWTLEDTAPAVPADALPHLFDYLYRVEQSRNRLEGGSGLGLALCQHIVEGHHGNIRASQSHLGGLAITCSFPLAPPH